MGPADALSQTDKVNTDDDNQEITLLKGRNWDFHIHTLDTALTEKITLSSTSNPIMTKALATMNDEKGEPWIPHTANLDWKFENGALYFKHWLYILEPAHHVLHLAQVGMSVDSKAC